MFNFFFFFYCGWEKTHVSVSSFTATSKEQVAVTSACKVCKNIAVFSLTLEYSVSFLCHMVKLLTLSSSEIKARKETMSQDRRKVT